MNTKNVKYKLLNMKFLLIIMFSFISFFVSENSRNCNYIKSGYYQLIYDADIAYLSDNKQLAYDKIRQA